jgi:hypothetical protein
VGRGGTRRGIAQDSSLSPPDHLLLKRREEKVIGVL